MVYDCNKNIPNNNKNTGSASIIINSDKVKKENCLVMSRLANIK